MVGELVIDETTYTARLRGRPLNCTFRPPSVTGLGMNRAHLQ